MFVTVTDAYSVVIVRGLALPQDLNDLRSTHPRSGQPVHRGHTRLSLFPARSRRPFATVSISRHLSIST